MEQPKKGRSRGRARPRDQPNRRPGESVGRGEAAAVGGTEEAARGGEAAAPAAVYPQQSNGGGRRTHRGVPRVDPVPPRQGPSQPPKVEEISKEMEDLQLERCGTRKATDTSGNDNTRPAHVTDKQGKSGEPIKLLANYFELLSKPTWCVYQYHCDFSPTVESSRMRRAFMREHKEKLGNCFLFDGMSDLKTSYQLGEELELFSKRNTDDQNIRISLKRVNELAPSHPELQRLFNTQMRRNLQHLKFQLLGRHYFDPSAVSEVEQYNLQIWQGCITAIRQHEQKLMMCVDTVHKVVRKETALQSIKSIANNFRGQSYREACIKELAGAIVMTRYNNRTYRIEDIDWSLNPTKTFDARDGPISYVAYYKQQYDITIGDLGQPLLLCTSKEKEIKRGASVSKKIYLIPEICVMTGLTEAMRANFTTMKELANYTRVNPARRVQNLMHFIKRVNSNPEVKAEMNAWGLQFSDRLVEIQGRILPGEVVVLKDNITKNVPQDKDFTVQIRADPMYRAMDLSDWIVIFTNRDKDKTQEMLGVLNSVARKLGMRMNRPKMCEVRDDRINTYMSAMKDSCSSSTELVMFILPNNKKERYDALKKFTCVDNAVPSQCILGKTISKPKALMTVATKVAIQLNCKLGGEPWALNIPFQCNVMVCGYDTYHDSSRKGRSAGAFVASLNTKCTRWYSQVNFHSAGGWEELSNHMTMNFTMALKKYNQINNALPDMILIYRDGVGDGQVRYVREWEIKQLTNVLNTQLAGRQTRWAYIIVNKKINTRFFRDQRGNYSNPPHGTCVDSVVTRFDRYDFFLVSQLATQGTVSPTMYNVIEDKSNIKPEYIQRLTYKLTHLYFNCSATISVPAPCQYAHKLAFLAGQSLHQPPQESLCDKLFYL